MDQLNKVKEEIEKVLAILGRAAGDGGLNMIDRDIILEHLREGYEAASHLDITNVSKNTNVKSAEPQLVTIAPAIDRRELIESLYGDEGSEKGSNETLTAAKLNRRIDQNDRLMLLEDVFFNDENLCDRALAKLDEADNVDDAYIYLYENFTLDDSKEGVRLLISLLESKFA